MDDILIGNAEVWQCLVEQCLQGNMQALKLYYERLDKMANIGKANKPGDKPGDDGCAEIVDDI